MAQNSERLFLGFSLELVKDQELQGVKNLIFTHQNSTKTLKSEGFGKF